MRSQIWMYVALLIIAVGAYGGYRYYNLLGDFKELTGNYDELQYNFSTLQESKAAVDSELTTEKEKNAAFESQIGEITGTVGRLNKLQKTDPEVLKKYSKIYFLNENYVPKNLVEIPTQYLYENGRKMQIQASTSPYLLRMVDAAKSDGLELRVISAYRSFTEQSSLKNSYSVTYGTGANRFSADQGYSEHQLGTAVDFTTIKLGAGFTSFKQTDDYLWLKREAYKYGFILSYPEGNTYYQFEPWHWRFVGTKLANRLHNEGENFYDVDQRVIDNYLINVFD